MNGMAVKGFQAALWPLACPQPGGLLCTEAGYGRAKQCLCIPASWCPVGWISIIFSKARTCSSVRGIQLELGAVALLCLYAAAAPAEAGMTTSFFSSLYLDHWSQATNQEKDILPKINETVYVTHERWIPDISLSSNPSSSGDKKLAQPKTEPKDQEMSWSDLQCLLSPVVPPRQL